MSNVPQTKCTVKIDIAAAYKLGYEDASQGIDQRPTFFFMPSSTQWHAYNSGYRTGSLLYTARTGIRRQYFTVEVRHRHTDQSPQLQDTKNYIPFQDVPAAYSNLPDYQRDDYVGM